MKTLLKSIVVSSLFLLTTPNLHAQSSIQGDILNWSHGEVPLIFNDYISKQKTAMGYITSTGEMSILLADNFEATMNEMANKAKENAPEGWEMKFNTVESLFGCSDEGVVYENAEVIIYGLPDLEAVENDGTTYGYLYCTNNPELSTWLNNYGQGNIAKGYYLRWFFAENEASAKGSCNMPNYTGNNVENFMDTTVYDLELRKGWNIIKYAITETFTSQTGKIAPSQTEITKIDEVPQDAQWLLVGD